MKYCAILLATLLLAACDDAEQRAYEAKKMAVIQSNLPDGCTFHVAGIYNNIEIVFVSCKNSTTTTSLKQGKSSRAAITVLER